MGSCDPPNTIALVPTSTTAMPNDKRKKPTLAAVSDDEPTTKPKKKARATPAADSDLPSKTLLPIHTLWPEQYKDEYRRHIQPKGTRTNPATDWVKKTITYPFIERFFTDLEGERKVRFADIVWRVSRLRILRT